MRLLEKNSGKIKAYLGGARDYIFKKIKDIKVLFSRLVKGIKATPAWLKSRPKAIKNWWIENKKKRKYHSFKLEKRLSPEPRDIPTSWKLTKEAFKFFFKYFWIFFGIFIVHVAAYALLVYGPTDFNLTEVQDTIKAFFGGDGSSATSTFALLGTVIGTQTQREGSSIYSFLIFLVISLADIWVIRALIAKKKFKIRDAFYSGMAPIIPVLVTLLVITIQFLPFSITSYIYIIGRTQGVFISGIEDLSFFLVALSAGLLSFYLITPTLISLYAVTLPNMYPLHTIKLTKEIISYRRLLVFRRVLALPLIVALIFFILLVALLRFYPQGGIWFVQLFPIVILPVIHIYLFKLYKSLI